MATSFDRIIKKCQKDWEAPELMTSAFTVSGNKLPFSSPLLNWCTYGGIPRNRITEFFGYPGGGKTSTSIDICKNAMDIFKQEYEAKHAEYSEKAAIGKKEYVGLLEDLEEVGPKKILYIDLENAFDVKWATTLGMDKEEITSEDSIFKIMTPPNIVAEDILQTTQEIIASNEVGLVVLDSVPTLVPRLELEKKIGERTVAALAGILSVWLRKIVPMLTRHDCTLILINQVRDNMDNPWDVKTPGGNAPKFYSSLRVLFQVGRPVDRFGNELKMSAENPDGYIINAKLIKQKSAPSDRKIGTYFLMAHEGIRPDFDYAKLAINKYQCIKKSGGWFLVCDPFTGEVLEDEDGKEKKLHGLPKVYEFLQTNTEYYDTLKRFVNEDLNGEDASVDAEEVLVGDEELAYYES